MFTVKSKASNSLPQGKRSQTTYHILNSWCECDLSFGEFFYIYFYLFGSILYILFCNLLLKNFLHRFSLILISRAKGFQSRNVLTFI